MDAKEKADYLIKKYNENYCKEIIKTKQQLCIADDLFDLLDYWESVEIEMEKLLPV